MHTARARPPSVQSTTEFAATDQQAEETTPWVGAAASEGGGKANQSGALSAIGGRQIPANTGH